MPQARGKEGYTRRNAFQPHLTGARARSVTFPDGSAKLYSWEHAHQPRARHQGNEGTPRGAAPSLVPGPLGSEGHRGNRRQTRGQGWANGPSHTAHLWPCREVIAAAALIYSWGCVDIISHLLLLLSVTRVFLIQQLWAEIYFVPSVMLDPGSKSVVIFLCVQI